MLESWTVGMPVSVSGRASSREASPPAKGPIDASTASEVEREVALKMGVDPSAVQLYLQARGLERVRRKVAGINRYYYRFCFTIGGLKSQSASYVRLGG